MIRVSEPVLGESELLYVNDCIKSGWISSQGKYIERFEESWAEYCGVKHGVAVSNGTAALQVAVDALELGPGDEVILPSFTIISCALAVVRSGATPVLVDCDPETFCMDVAKVADAITPRTRAIMPVHMYGHPVDMDPLLQIATSREIAIIEDAAQAHGSEYLSQLSGQPRWLRCGSLGTVATFSFFANKLVTTGEGGMLLTDDSRIAGRCRALRNLFFAATPFVHEEPGYNFRLTNLQAAVGVAQVERVPKTLERKRAIAADYSARLAGVTGIKLPVERHWARSNCWMYAILLDDSMSMDGKGLADQLKTRGVETRPFFRGMHEQKAFTDLGMFSRDRFPVTEHIQARGIYLPSGVGLTTGEIESVCEALRDVLA